MYMCVYIYINIPRERKGLIEDPPDNTGGAPRTNQGLCARGWASSPGSGCLLCLHFSRTHLIKKKKKSKRERERKRERDRERETERERQRERDRESESARERECVCVCSHSNDVPGPPLYPSL